MVPPEGDYCKVTLHLFDERFDKQVQLDAYEFLRKTPRDLLSKTIAEDGYTGCCDLANQAALWLRSRDGTAKMFFEWLELSNRLPDPNGRREQIGWQAEFDEKEFETWAERRAPPFEHWAIENRRRLREEERTANQLLREYQAEWEARRRRSDPYRRALARVMQVLRWPFFPFESAATLFWVLKEWMEFPWTIAWQRGRNFRGRWMTDMSIPSLMFMAWLVWVLFFLRK